MANGHGGARAGAGRKPKNQVHADVIETAEGQIAGSLVKVITNVQKLANGGYKRTKSVWKPAGLVQVVKTEKVDGPMGEKILRHLEPAFPGMEATKLVCISKTEEWAEPNLAANIYLADRIMGKTAPQTDSNEIPPSELPDDLAAAIAKVWSVSDEDDESDFNEALEQLAETAQEHGADVTFAEEITQVTTEVSTQVVPDVAPVAPAEPTRPDTESGPLAGAFTF